MIFRIYMYNHIMEWVGDKTLMGVQGHKDMDPNLV